jgi:hypothetical protein
MAKKKEAASISDIVSGLAQAAANAYDGAYTEDGELLEVGLKREEGDLILDKRVLDGFGVVFYGPMMCIKYHSEVQLKEVYANGFETEIEQRLADIASYLKKEYRKITGKSVSLTKEGEVEVMVESTSRVRSWVTAKMHYKIGGLDKVAMVGEANVDPLHASHEASWKKFVELGGWKGKRPKNDSRKKES